MTVEDVLKSPEPWVPAAEFQKAYEAWLAPEARELFHMPYDTADAWRKRIARATELGLKGHPIDLPLFTSMKTEGPFWINFWRLWAGIAEWTALNGKTFPVSINVSDYPAWKDLNAPPPAPPDNSVVKGFSGGFSPTTGRQLWWSGPNGDDEFETGEQYTDARGTFVKVVTANVMGQFHIWEKL